MSISFFDDLGGLFSHFCQLSSLRSLGRSSEVDRNPKKNISFFEDFFPILGGGGGYIGQLKSNFEYKKKNQNIMLTQNSTKIPFEILFTVFDKLEI